MTTPTPRKKAAKKAKRSPGGPGYVSIGKFQATVGLMFADLEKLQARCSSLEQSIADLMPKSDALPPPDAAKGLRDIVRGVAISSADINSFALRAAAALCRHRAKCCKGFATNAGDSSAATLEAFAANLDAAAGGAA